MGVVLSSSVKSMKGKRIMLTDMLTLGLVTSPSLYTAHTQSLTVWIAKPHQSGYLNPIDKQIPPKGYAVRW